MYAVGEQRDCDFAFGFDPDRRTGKTQMAHGGLGETMARTRIFGRWRVPSERPRRALNGSVAGPELMHDFLRDKVRAPVVTSQQFMRDEIHLLHRREQPRMSGNAAHREGVFVVDLARQEPLAERTYGGRREHLGDRFEAACANERNIDEVGGADVQRAKDVIAAKAVERHAAHLLDCLAQYDEVQVRVDCAGAGRRLGPFAMNLLVDVFLRAAARHEVDFSALFDLGDLLVERTPSGKTRAMCEKRVTRSSRRILESRASIITATVVASGLVSEERSKTVSSRIGERSGTTERKPKAPS